MRKKRDHVDGRGLSRRSFLKGAGGVIGATALGSAAATAAEKPTAEASPAEVASREGMRAYPAAGSVIALRVNGKEFKTVATPSMTLLEVLREKMDLTGSKEDCGRGACGACTVLLDGRSINSCLTLAIDAIGSEITTVEGLVKDGKLDAVQAAFVEKDACQCGYCTPGFVVRARALLNETPKPTAEEIKRGLSGNICRCAAYVKIFEAVSHAIQGGRP